MRKQIIPTFKKTPLNQFKAGDRALIHCGIKGKGYWVALITRIISPKRWVIKTSIITAGQITGFATKTINPIGRDIVRIGKRKGMK